MKVVAIDPGFTGAIVCMYFPPDHQPAQLLGTHAMPVKVFGKEKEIDPDRVAEIIRFYGPSHIFLERAVSFGMGTKSAFNYGRGFGYVELAIRSCLISYSYVEPSKWTKDMHAGISSDLKGKVKSQMAIERLFPHLLSKIPQVKGKRHDGVVDAMLIADWGRRQLGAALP